MILHGLHAEHRFDAAYLMVAMAKCGIVLDGMMFGRHLLLELLLLLVALFLDHLFVNW